MARNYAWSVGGSRASGNVPKNYGQGVTLLGVMNGKGELAMLEVRITLKMNSYYGCVTGVHLRA